MFLSSSSSTDEGSPNNPSTSCNFLNLTNSSDELGQSHHSSFSIRDYACNYRTKNIQKSWAFSSTSLQHCMKHGLTDPLPPMQPLNFVVSHPPEASSSTKPHIAPVEVISSNHVLEETKQGFENRQVAKVNKNPSKKCGLIEKRGACVDSDESKEDQGCLFPSSECMALRTCPICKAFWSASNTSLNAHICKCPSVDSGHQPSKPRVKSGRKVKTMVDIYANAKRWTLEDLDQRNGTKWADKNRPQVCNKRKKRVDEDAAGIGPVYIDGKGQKLRIISDNEKASDPSREHKEDVSEKESSKEGKGNYRSFRKILEKEDVSENRHSLISRGPSHETVSSPLKGEMFNACG